jgi:hypothetical protein
MAAAFRAMNIRDMSDQDRGVGGSFRVAVRYFNELLIDPNLLSTRWAVS